MAIVKMKKLTLAMSGTIREQLLDELQALGAVQIDSLDIQASEENSKVLDSWATGLSNFSAEQSSMEENRREIFSAIIRINEFFKISAPSFEVTSIEKIDILRQKYDISQLASELKNLDRTTRETESLLAVLNNELQLIKKWSSVVNDFDPIFGKSAFLKGVIGHIPESSFEDLINTLVGVTDLADVLTVWAEDKEVYCYIVASPESWDQVSAVIKEFPFNPISITKRSGNTAGIIHDLETEISILDQKHTHAMQEWKIYSEKVKDLALIHDMLEMDIQRQQASSMSLSSETVNFFRAWVPEEFMPKVEAILSIHHKSIDITIEDPTEEEYEKVPVFLKNNVLTAPFASLTNMYGTPMYGHTVDPTPHLSIFYFIYYGICLGDALYGAVLALFSLIMVFKNRSNHSMANFYALLAWSGFSAVIAGVLFGSYAGDLFSKYISIPALYDLRFTFADGSSFFDKPLFVLFVSLFLGAFQLWYGYWIKFFVSFKNTGVQAVFNEFPWIILLAGFFGWAVFSWIGGMAGLSLVSPMGVNIFFLLMKVGAGLIILNSIRKGFQKGFVAGILGPFAGAWELYGISGYLSNLLSYARLLALGLSSGIIANVFNQLCFGMINSLSEITPILSIFGIVLLIFLHTFNLVLGGFGAFVHALRLQFVEFFGQFIEGGGKDYTPLVRQGSHYTVK